MVYRKKVEPIFGKTYTLQVTEECNLRCKYCYEDKCKKFMTKEVAKDAIDFLFKEFVTKKPEDSHIYELIGGEPLIDLDLCRFITGYLEEKIIEHKLPRKNHYISITTNGTMFTPEVKQYLMELKTKFPTSVSVSLDGVKEIHDLNRSNSFDAIMKDFFWWRQQFPWNTIKSTLNSESLPYLAESVKFFIEELGLEDIFCNQVFEDVWKEGDVEIFHDQLKQIADYMLEDQRYKKHNVTLLDIVLLWMPDMTGKTWCGCGNHMLTVTPEGNLAPCLRFSTNSPDKRLLCGSIYTGMDYNKIWPFMFYCNSNKSSKCQNCEAQVGCAWCPAQTYDELGTIFDRTTHLCNFQFKRREVCIDYYTKMAEIEGLPIEEIMKK
jgi:uncharacterized protein